MARDNLTTERPTASTNWAEAFHNYERAKEAYVREDRRFKVATAAWDASEKDEAASAAYTTVEKPWEATLDALGDARKALLLAAAPDAEAMLFKLNILADYLTECDDEDAPTVRSIRDDARRLFGGA